MEIYVKSGSTNNKIYDNTIMNSKSHALLIKNASSANTFYYTLLSAIPEGLKIGKDATSKHNIFSPC